MPKEGYGSVRDRVHPPWAVTRGEMARLIGWKTERPVKRLYQRLGIQEKEMPFPPRRGGFRQPPPYKAVHWKDAKRVFLHVLKQEWDLPKLRGMRGEPPIYPWDLSPGALAIPLSPTATRLPPSSSIPSTKSGPPPTGPRGRRTKTPSSAPTP